MDIHEWQNACREHPCVAHIDLTLGHGHIRNCGTTRDDVTKHFNFLEYVTTASVTLREISSRYTQIVIDQIVVKICRLLYYTLLDIFDRYHGIFKLLKPRNSYFYMSAQQKPTKSTTKWRSGFANQKMTRFECRLYKLNLLFCIDKQPTYYRLKSQLKYINTPQIVYLKSTNAFFMQQDKYVIYCTLLDIFRLIFF